VKNANRAKRVKIVASANRAKIVANNGASAGRHASRVMKMPVRRAFPTVRNQRFCAAAINQRFVVGGRGGAASLRSKYVRACFSTSAR
jgi:hypothetical protein